MKKVLIAGCGGDIGLTLLEGLKELKKYDIVPTSRTPKPQFGVQKLDITDAAACREIFAGVDVVIHCAYNMKAAFRDTFISEQLNNHIVGTFNVYEAALSNKVSRVIFCSSNHVVGFAKVTEKKLIEQDPMLPDSFYGLTKCFNELMGGYYSDRFGVSVINVRLGHLNEYDKPKSQRTANIFLSKRDCIRFFELAIDADDKIKKETLFCTSDNSGNYFDLAYAEKVLGYKPKDDGNKIYLEKGFESDEVSKVENMDYVGGSYVNDVETVPTR